VRKHGDIIQAIGGKSQPAVSRGAFQFGQQAIKPQSNISILVIQVVDVAAD
jgi:hypothetical protein